MAKLYIFGIGGTGSRVLRAFTMMLAAGVSVKANDIVPIIIDPDASNADLTRTVQLMNCYRSVRSNLSFPDGVNTDFFRRDLVQLFPNYTLRIQDTANKSFKQFIDLSSMDRPTQALMRILFSEKNLQSSMNVGFKGNPNIGSVVLNQIVESEEFGDFANSFASGDKIFIVSSIFGGTGASGFPLLLKTLRTNKVMPNNDLINKAEIGAITLLPYFKLAPSNKSEIDSSTFVSKTKSALAYYENNISRNDSINALYYLGDDVSNIYKNHEGGSMQQNDAHLVEFLAASAIVDFCNKEHPDTVNKEFGLHDLKDSVTFGSFYEEQRRQLFEPLTKFIMMSNCLTDKYDYYCSSSFDANYNHFKDIYDSQFMSSLRIMCGKYKQWLGEMKGNKRSLDLFNLNTGNKPFEVVTGLKAKTVLSAKSDYELVTDRLNDAVKKKCQSEGDCDKFLEMFSLGTERLIKKKFNL